MCLMRMLLDPLDKTFWHRYDNFWVFSASYQFKLANIENPEKKEDDIMALYMDVHHKVEGLTAEAVGRAH